MHPKGNCSVPDCEKTAHTRGWCEMHYARMIRHGSTDNPRPTDEARFWSKVNKNGPVPDYRPDLGPCWLWSGAMMENGYGTIRYNGRNMLTHRVAYELLVAPIPPGLTVDHLCRVRHCVNHAHLEPVTQQVNILRGTGFSARNAPKTHCPKGHPYDTENTYWWRDGRQCRTCRQARDRQRNHINTQSRSDRAITPAT